MHSDKSKAYFPGSLTDIHFFRIILSDGLSTGDYPAGRLSDNPRLCRPFETPPSNERSSQPFEDVKMQSLCPSGTVQYMPRKSANQALVLSRDN